MTQAAQILQPTQAGLDRAVQALRAGSLVAFPTETVYGLGADAGSDRAVTAIFEAKGRPQFNPLITHVANRSGAEALGVLDARAASLADAFWPGPLTIVVPRRPDCGISWLVTAGMASIGLRCPAHDVAQALLRAFGGPIAAPSANRSGTVSPTTAAHVAASLGDRIDVILDGGPARHGLESTIIGLVGAAPVLLRPGTITRSEIEALIGPLAEARDTEAAPLAPGRLSRHYATSKPLRLDATSPRDGEAFLAFGAPQAGARAMLNLSPTGDLREAAANLFAMLRTLDGTEASGIAVMPIPATGLGEAINDRLRRAAVRDTGAQP